MESNLISRVAKIAFLCAETDVVIPELCWSCSLSLREVIVQRSPISRGTLDLTWNNISQWNAKTTANQREAT